MPGVAVAVVRRGEVLKAKGYGFANVEHEVPVTDQTIFQSGSVGKQFTATAVMLLVEDGALSLADRLKKFYPDGPAAWDPITIRHLLTHTSGIPDYTDGKVDNRRDYTEDELARMAFELPLDFAPGDQWKYSNTALRPARRDRPQGVRQILRRCPPRSRIHASRHDDGACHQRKRHRRSPGCGLSTRQRTS